jgi:hypothetical protein
MSEASNSSIKVVFILATNLLLEVGAGDNVVGLEQDANGVIESGASGN